MNLWMLGWLLKSEMHSLSRLLVLIIIGHLLLVVACELLLNGFRPTWRECLGFVLGIAAVFVLEWQGVGDGVGQTASTRVPIPATESVRSQPNGQPR